MTKVPARLVRDTSRDLLQRSSAADRLGLAAGPPPQFECRATAVRTQQMLPIVVERDFDGLEEWD